MKMFEREEIDYSEESSSIFLESKKNTRDEEKLKEAWVCCFLATHAPSFEDFYKLTKLNITKRKYEELCKKMFKKTI